MVGEFIEIVLRVSGMVHLFGRHLPVISEVQLIVVCGKSVPGVGEVFVRELAIAALEEEISSGHGAILNRGEVRLALLSMETTDEAAQDLRAKSDLTPVPSAPRICRSRPSLPGGRHRAMR